MPSIWHRSWPTCSRRTRSTHVRHCSNYERDTTAATRYMYNALVKLCNFFFKAVSLTNEYGWVENCKTLYPVTKNIKYFASKRHSGTVTAISTARVVGTCSQYASNNQWRHQVGLVLHGSLVAALCMTNELWPQEACAPRWLDWLRQLVRVDTTMLNTFRSRRDTSNNNAKCASVNHTRGAYLHERTSNVCQTGLHTIRIIHQNIHNTIHCWCDRIVKCLLRLPQSVKYSCLHYETPTVTSGQRTCTCLPYAQIEAAMHKKETCIGLRTCRTESNHTTSRCDKQCASQLPDW